MSFRTAADLPEAVRSRFEIVDWRNAIAILSTVHERDFLEILDVLSRFQLRHSEISVGGGNKSPMARFIDQELGKYGWVEKSFDTKIVVDNHERPSPTHSVDCFKGRVALEVEWNNKDPFYDRDLNNFRLLFDLRAISVGVIITRCDELQVIFNALGKGSSYGASTTHMSKLLPRLEGGSGGGCPILVFGITEKLYVEDV